jgi:hypothetical protein
MSKNILLYNALFWSEVTSLCITRCICFVVMNFLVKMGIDISTLRLRIGVFSQKSKFQESKVSFGRFRITFRLCTCLFVPLVVCGDVQENPSLPKTKQNESRRQSHVQPALNLSQSVPLGSSSASAMTWYAEPPTGRNTEVVTTRQRTTSSYAKVVSGPSSCSTNNTNSIF